MSEAEETARQVIEHYRIAKPEADDQVPADRQPWRRLGTYQSPICVAAEMSLMVESWTDEQRKIAKVALFRYLRRVQHTLLDFGMVYPVAAVISVPEKTAPIARKIGSWTSDQGWHRGGFTLYVEQTDENRQDADERLRGLLVPEVKDLMNPNNAQKRGLEWFADSLIERSKGWADVNDQSSKFANDLAQICAERIRDRNERAGDFLSLDDFDRNIKIAAGRLVEHGRQ